MPESPDFDQIARAVVERNGWKDDQPLIRDVVQQLRLAWNARGAADREKLAAYLSRREEGTLLDDGIVSVEGIDRALRTLDR